MPNRVVVLKARRVKRGPPLDLTQKNKEKFARQSEEAIRMDFINGIERFKKRLPKAKIDQAFNDHGYDGLRKVIPWEHLPDDLKPVAGHLKKLMGNTKKTVDRTARGEVSADYLKDAHNPRMAKLTQNRIDSYLRDLSEEGAQSLHRTIADAQAKGVSPKDLANRIKQTIGLNERQNRALARYENGLINSGKFTDAQVAKLKKQRYNKMLDQRAKMIAVTETRVAANAVETAAWQAQAEDGLIPKDAKRVWVTEPDCCDVCTQLSGVAVGLYEVWRLSDGRTFSQPGAVHPHCRCTSYLSTEDD